MLWYSVFRSILFYYSANTYLEHRKTAEWLSMPLLSTCPPLHYWANDDKGIPSWITNQAVLIVAWDQNGTPSSISVAVPKIYFNFQGASYSISAKQFIDAIENIFSIDVLSWLCGVAADEPYQRFAFQNQLYEIMLILKIHKDLVLPKT